MSNFSKVGTFMKTFGQEVKTTPSLSSEKINNLRISLINEELEEFKEAIRNNDLKEAADALTEEGNTNYYVDVIYNNSQYVYWLDHPAVGSGSAWGSNITNTSKYAAPSTNPAMEEFVSGANGSTVTNGQRQ